MLSLLAKAKTKSAAKVLCGIGLLAAFLSTGCFAQEPAGARQQFAEVAKKLGAFPPDRKFYSIPGTPIGLGMEFANGWPVTPGTAEYQHLMQTDYPVPFLLSLLKDGDPKIRTLAAGSLVAKGDPRLQRYLAPLVADQSLTFDVIITEPTDNYTPPHYAPQTVSMAALQLAEKPSKETFEQYWAVHANREYCADWFLWQFHRPQFAPVARQQIQNVPSPDRELIILWIGKGRRDFANERYAGYSEAELLAAEKQLGRDNVLAVLRNQSPTTDPDILHNGGPGTTAYEHYSEMGHFLLAHAKDVLDPSDAEALFDLETTERNIKNPQVPTYREWWPIAAASLRPKEADAILDAAQIRWPNAPNIQLARWDIEGPASLPRILQWFYSSPQAQQQLPLAVERADPNDSYKSLVAAILASDGRLKINGEAMYRFAVLVKKWNTNFDAQFIDWVYAQPADPHPELARPPRELVVRTSGVARKLVLDPRFSKADGQLLYVIEQSLVGTLHLTKEQSLQLDQLIREIDFGVRPSPPTATLQEIRNLLRKGVRDH